MHEQVLISADEALKKLISGNKQYLATGSNSGDISPEKRRDTAVNGQHPYALIITCSDSRVIPENIFSAGIGDLFVIRLAGNVIDNHQLGSIEYAADHLGVGLVVVMGHTHCGAVDAAINHNPDGYIRFITNKIKAVIGKETDSYAAACLNVNHAVREIRECMGIKAAESSEDFQVIGAIYDIETGRVKFL